MRCLDIHRQACHGVYPGCGLADICHAVQAVVEDMKHNIEGIEAFAWQPQTPARQRASSLYGACALLSKLSSHPSGSLLREGSQVCTSLTKHGISASQPRVTLCIQLATLPILIGWLPRTLGS